MDKKRVQNTILFIIGWFYIIIGIIALFILGRILLKIIGKRLSTIVDDGDDSNVSQKEQMTECDYIH